MDVKVNKGHHYSLYNNYNGKEFRNIGNQRNRGNCYVHASMIITILTVLAWLTIVIQLKIPTIAI